MTRATRARPLVLASCTALLASAVLTLSPAAGERPAAFPPEEPKLLVILVVDQMRADYVDRLRPLWTSGFRRLVTEGAVFERNFYPYLQTVTCAGHATIGSGSFPSSHGIILNAWWRGTRNASCTDDPTVAGVPYEEGGESRGHSAVQLAVPSLGDRLRARSPASRVVTLSNKPRSAVMLAGHGGLVTWRDDEDVWATSTAFAAAPDPAVQAFVTAHPTAADRDIVWERLLDPSAYTGDDDAAGEAPPRGWTRTFPHPLAGEPGTAASRFPTLWETSPLADDYIGRMATHLVRTMRLGQGETTDYLGVSFSALDYVGHAFGPDSHEAQDTLLRLDRTIGTLLDALDTMVGRDRYVVGLSADHGAAPVPEARRQGGKPAGRVVPAEVARIADAALVPTLGPGPHVARAEYTQVYLTEATKARVEGRPEMLKPAIEALRKIPGVLRVLASDGLERQRGSRDRVVRAAALSYYPGRSGQIVVIPREYFVMSAATARGTTHGTLHAYDQHVPLVFLGAAFKPGRYRARTTPADLAPTLAATVGLDMPGADGQPRREALRARQGS